MWTPPPSLETGGGQVCGTGETAGTERLGDFETWDGRSRHCQDAEPAGAPLSEARHEGVRKVGEDRCLQMMMAVTL